MSQCWRWLRLRGGVTAAYVLIVFAFAFGQWQDSQQRNDLRLAICNLASGFTNALVHAVPPPTSEEDRAKKQAQLDAFTSDLQRRLASANCQLQVAPISKPGG